MAVMKSTKEFLQKKNQDSQTSFGSTKPKFPQLHQHNLVPISNSQPSFTDVILIDRTNTYNCRHHSIGGQNEALKFKRTKRVNTFPQTKLQKTKFRKDKKLIHQRLRSIPRKDPLSHYLKTFHNCYNTCIFLPNEESSPNTRRKHTQTPFCKTVLPNQQNGKTRSDNLQQQIIQLQLVMIISKIKLHMNAIKAIVRNHENCNSEFSVTLSLNDIQILFSNLIRQSNFRHKKLLEEI
ncbi:hypothetical protein M0813_19916 [Anaeramoeba flamelloides]|uniref:Uncharacterized protein n=1 Tax=Anaeramoeba flamelloides TaxID=1746091 RepID=A0AAV8A0M1_9EUKA|nr:hypothetical protein M0812_08200 [Anaeramoeba flamelloides]KAJ6245497.1 hypothetical protein M0813_19916 [Anaeramoeba flamelloides]